MKLLGQIQAAVVHEAPKGRPNTIAVKGKPGTAQIITQPTYWTGKGHKSRRRKRNEPLDCRVYARAAASEVGLDRWSEERWTREREELGLDLEVSAPKTRKRTKERGRKKPGRFDRWRRP